MPAHVRRRGVCVACQVGQSGVARGLAGRRPAKEGVTAVASAAGSAARRQPTQRARAAGRSAEGSRAHRSEEAPRHGRRAGHVGRPGTSAGGVEESAAALGKRARPRRNAARVQPNPTGGRERGTTGGGRGVGPARAAAKSRDHRHARGKPVRRGPDLVRATAKPGANGQAWWRRRMLAGGTWSRSRVSGRTTRMWPAWTAQDDLDEGDLDDVDDPGGCDMAVLDVDDLDVEAVLAVELRGPRATWRPSEADDWTPSRRGRGSRRRHRAGKRGRSALRRTAAGEGRAGAGRAAQVTSRSRRWPWLPRPPTRPVRPARHPRGRRRDLRLRRR